MMRLLVVALAVVVVCVSCSSSDSEIVTPTPTIDMKSQEPSIITPTQVVQAVSAVQPSATSTPEPIVTVTATPFPVTNTAIVPGEREGDVNGVPFSTEDVRSVVEGEYGYS